MATRDPKFYVNIQRIDEDERMVYGYGTREDLVDSYGTVIDLDSVRACMDEYMKFPTIREMHQLCAAGKTVEYTVDDIGVQLGVKVVDDQAWKKVKEGVYRGFSLGGKKSKQVDGRIYMKSITEFSLVDRPSNEGCLIDEYRIFREEGEGMNKNGGVPFADPKNQKFPLDSEKHIRRAWDQVHRGAVAAAYSADELAVVRSAVSTAWGEKIAGETPPEVTITRRADGSEVARGYWDSAAQRYITDECDDAMTALYALTNLKALLAKEETEAHPEAQAQIDALISAISAIKAFVASEIMENDPAGEEVEGVELAGGKTDDVTRAGKVISKKNADKVQAIHDHAADMGATCRCADATRIAAAGGKIAIIGATAGDSTVVRLAALLGAAGLDHQVVEDADVQRLAGTTSDETIFRVEGFDMEIPGIEGAKAVIGTLVERVSKLEGQPAPPKGVARVVGKEQDLGGEVAGKEAEKVEPAATPAEAIKRIHQGGGTRIERL